MDFMRKTRVSCSWRRIRRRNLPYDISRGEEARMARRRKQDPKVEALREARTLNPHPDAVADAEFGSSGFFDARDLVQVKYEMVRRVQVDGVAGGHAAAAVGVSRPPHHAHPAAPPRGGPPR